MPLPIGLPANQLEIRNRFPFGFTWIVDDHFERLRSLNLPSSHITLSVSFVQTVRHDRVRNEVSFRTGQRPKASGQVKFWQQQRRESPGRSAGPTRRGGQADFLRLAEQVPNDPTTRAGQKGLAGDFSTPQPQITTVVVDCPSEISTLEEETFEFGHRLWTKAILHRVDGSGTVTEDFGVLKLVT